MSCQKQKKCPNCGRMSHENYCPHCGARLKTPAELFEVHKKYAKKEFLGKCKEVVGDDGCAKLGQAAWFIATNTPENYEYLQGEKMGEPGSHEMLGEAVAGALNIVRLMKDFRGCYNAEGGFEMTSRQNATLIVWGGKE